MQLGIYPTAHPRHEADSLVQSETLHTPMQLEAYSPTQPRSEVDCLAQAEPPHTSVWLEVYPLAHPQPEADHLPHAEPSRTPMQLEVYPPAYPEADRLTQAEPCSFDELEPSVPETTLHYSKKHVKLLDDEALLADSTVTLPQSNSHEIVIFMFSRKSIHYTETDLDQVTPPSSIHTLPQHNFQRSARSNRQTGDQQMISWLHELEVSPLILSERL